MSEYSGTTAVYFQKEDYVNLVSEIDEIAPRISYEVDIYPGVTKPNIDHDKLIAMGDMVLAVVARNEEGKMVGFTISLITYDILFKHVLTSYSLFYYLLPEYRGGGNGTRLFEVTEEYYDEIGVERSFIPRKLHIDNQELFRKLEYMPVETTYTKYRMT